MRDSAAIRRATSADRGRIEQIVAEAYAEYVPRLGRKPSTMLDDYRRHIETGAAWVLQDGHEIAGVLVLLEAGDHLHLDNVAVAPAFQGRGMGGRLIGFAEAEARRRGFAEIRLTTNPRMSENLAMYARLGYRETGRGRDGVLEFVFLRKHLGSGDAH